MRIPKDKKWVLRKMLGDAKRYEAILAAEGNPREGEYTLSPERREELRQEVHRAHAEIVQLLREILFC